MVNNQVQQDKEEKAYRDFFSYMGNASEISQLEERRKKDPRSKVKDKLRGKLEDIGYDYAKSLGVTVPKDQMDPKTLQNYWSTLAQTRYEQASNNFSENSSSILKRIEGSKLEKLLGNEDVLKSVQRDEREIVDSYMRTQQVKALKDRYESGDKLEEKEEKVYMGFAAKAISDGILEKNIDGVSKDLLESTAALVGNSVMEGNHGDIYSSKIKDYINEGIKKELNESEKSYRELVEKKKYTAGKVVEDILGRWAKSEDPEEFNKAMNMAYEVGK